MAPILIACVVLMVVSASTTFVVGEKKSINKHNKNLRNKKRESDYKDEK